MIASAPGKLIVTGEYAVLDGAPAIVVAIDRRAIAQRNATPRGSSPFLLAVADEIAARRGASHEAARAALEISVDSTAFYHRLTKLGIGSSAAVTVAATALALGTANRDEVLAVALAAHARAQGPRGARGSGADIAASVHGGTIVFSLSAEAVASRSQAAPGPSEATSHASEGSGSRGSQSPSAASRSEGSPRSAGGTQPPSEPAQGSLGSQSRSISLSGMRVSGELPEGLSLTPRARTTTQSGVRGAVGEPGEVLSQPSHESPCRIERRRWPSSVAIVPFFTGVAADTAQLVARVDAAREAQRTAVDAALAAIADASRAACAALAAPPDIATVALIGAIALAGHAMDRLAAATGMDLVPECVTAARSALTRLGGTAKTTGAGGGDVGIAVFPATVDATVVTRLLIEAGCQPLRISLDDTGVDLRPGAS
jgi:mevalonate kinase